MKFNQLYSSSTSNLYTVTAANGKRLLLECGLPWAKLQKALNYDFKDICGCLVTHEHKDHSKAVLDVMKAGIDVYASEGTFAGCGIKNGQRRAKRISKSQFNLNDTFEVLPFSTIHDASESLGFVVHEIETGENLLFATDTAYIKPYYRKIRFNVIAIECSYQSDILKAREKRGDINRKVADRLLDSHQEKRVAMRYISDFCDLKRCREIHLLHTSADNLNKKQTQKDFQEKFFIETIIAGKRKSHST